MKYFDYDAKLRNERIRRKRQRRQRERAIARAKRIQMKARGLELESALPKITYAGSSAPVAHVVAPRELSFERDHSGVTRFTNTLRDLYAADLPCYMDFTGVQFAGPAAALHVAAEVDRWRRVDRSKRGVRAYDLDQWSPEIRIYLRDLGLFDLLETPNPPDDPPNSNAARILRMRRRAGITSADVSPFRDELMELSGANPDKNRFYDAVVEAMTNVVDHAYAFRRPEGWPILPKGWWLTAGYVPATRLLQVVFMDQGVGIPARLPRSSIWENIRGIQSAVGLKDDAQRIEAALKYGRSSTKAKGRGKGFSDMQELVDQTNGKLRVLSGRGECIYDNNGTKGKNHARPVVGTLIQWSLTVPV